MEKLMENYIKGIEFNHVSYKIITFFFWGKLRGCLVCVFKQHFLVFKHIYTKWAIKFQTHETLSI